MNSQGSGLIKKKLIENIESNFPPERVAVLKKQILSMSDEQLEKFMEKNSARNGNAPSCIFCSLASGTMKTYKIGETKDAVAILEINPVSRGHTIILPKEHFSLEKIPEDIKKFAQQIAEKIQGKLNPKDVEIASVNFQDHGVINIIPVYNNESIKSERYKADKEELEEISEILNKKQEVIESRQKKEKIARKKGAVKISSRGSWLPKRIP